MIETRWFRENKGGDIEALIQSEMDRSGTSRNVVEQRVREVQQLDEQVRHGKKQLDEARKTLNEFAATQNFKQKLHADQETDDIVSSRTAIKEKKKLLKEMEQNLAVKVQSLQQQVKSFRNVLLNHIGSHACESVNDSDPYSVTMLPCERSTISKTSGVTWISHLLQSAACLECREPHWKNQLKGKWLDETKDLPIMYNNLAEDNVAIFLCAGDIETSEYATRVLCMTLAKALNHAGQGKCIGILAPPHSLDDASAYCVQLAVGDKVIVSVANNTDYLSRPFGIRSGPKKLKSVHDSKKFVHMLSVRVHDSDWIEANLASRFAPRLSETISLTPVPRAQAIMELLDEPFEEELTMEVDSTLALLTPEVDPNAAFNAIDLEMLEVHLKRFSFVTGSSVSVRDVFLSKALRERQTPPYPPVQFPHLHRWLQNTSCNAVE